MSNEEIVHVGDEEVSLMDIAGLDMTDMAEYRQTVTPAGKFLWRITEAKLEARDVRDKEADDGSKIKKPAITFELESQNCLALTDDKLDPAKFIGIKHFESFFINDPVKDLGRVKALLVDIGMACAGNLEDLLAEAQGMEFVSDISNVHDKNNTDIVYANMKKPMSVAKFEEQNAG